MNLSIFTVFLKNKNIIFKIRRSKVTDYAALMLSETKSCKSSAGRPFQIFLTGFPQALEIVENPENHIKKFHAWNLKKTE